MQGELADLLEDNEEYLISDSVRSSWLRLRRAPFSGEERRHGRWMVRFSPAAAARWSGQWTCKLRLGAWLNRNCELFPKTVQLLKQSGTFGAPA